MKKSVALAYSGGLDTSVAIKMLQEGGYDVLAVCVDVGQKENLQGHIKRAEALGAEAVLVDAKPEFADKFIAKAIMSNLRYEDTYPGGTALARPLICSKVVQEAQHAFGSGFAVAHGCTGMGNDQVRFDVSFTLLAPSSPILAPVREKAMSREEEMAYAEKNSIPLDTHQGIYSIDECLWGRSVECGVLEDMAAEPPEDAFSWTSSPKEAPDEPQHITITFEGGIPVKLDGEPMGMMQMVDSLNSIAGKHGIGRIDHIEDRVIGIKSREVYEYPAAEVLLTAHKALEKATLPKDVLKMKWYLDDHYSELVYHGFWYSPLRACLDAFMTETQKYVNGEVCLKLFKGNVALAGLSSEKSLYIGVSKLADKIDAKDVEGYLACLAFPYRVWASTYGGVVHD